MTTPKRRKLKHKRPATVCPVVPALSAKGRSQRWLARQMGVNSTTLWRWLARPGRWHVPARRLAQIAKHSGVQLDVLQAWVQAEYTAHPERGFKQQQAA